MKSRFYIVLILILSASVVLGCKSRRKNRCATCPTWSEISKSLPSEHKLA